jgi:ATP-dependent protease ClpP protease subunit
MLRRHKKQKLDGDEESQDTTEDEVNHINGSIYFYAEINSKNILKLIKCINEANEFVFNKEDEIEKMNIKLFVNSGGGDAFAGLSGMDHVRKNKIPITTIADGYVASAATLLMLGGHQRIAMANARILIHQLSTGFWGKYVDLLDEVQNSKELMNAFKIIYSSKTSLDKRKLQSLLKKELHMNANQALEVGFVSSIM